MKRVLIVIAHGSRIEAANLEFTAMLQTIDYAALGYDGLAGAFLEAANPSLEHTVSRLDEQQSASSIDIYPMFFNKGRHVEQDIPSLVQVLTGKHSDIEFRLLPYFGSYPALGTAIGQHISTLES
jgi:sirohydrochlorin ferrochelatase